MRKQGAGMDLRDFLDSVPAGIAIVDQDTRQVLFVNTHGLNMLRMDMAELLGGNCTTVLCSNLSGRCPVLDQGAAITQRRCVLQTKDGRRIPVQKTITRGEFEGVPCLVEYFRDISEELKLEALKEDLERISRHDLKTPLVQIINLAELLLLEDSLRPELKTYASMIQKTGRRMARIINASLDLYRLEKGVYSLTPESIRLKGMVKEIVAEVQSQFQDQGVSFDLSFEEVAVWGEDALVYCALSNLIKNAVEATPSGGTVRIAIRKGEAATVTIHNPLPVPAEIRDKFLEKYATCGKPHGTGLGTYSALLSVKAMHGDLTFETSEEAGTTVQVTLPLASAEPAYHFQHPTPVS